MCLVYSHMCTEYTKMFELFQGVQDFTHPSHPRLTVINIILESRIIISRQQIVWWEMPKKQLDFSTDKGKERSFSSLQVVFQIQTGIHLQYKEWHFSHYLWPASLIMSPGYKTCPPNVFYPLSFEVYIFHCGELDKNKQFPDESQPRVNI